MFHIIKTKENIECFLDQTNALHDGYIIGAQYINDGIAKLERGRYFNPEKTRLMIQVLVTSIGDSIVEMGFENLLDWQIKDSQWDITDTSVLLDESGSIVWLDDIYTTAEEMKKGSYVIAKTMRWRIKA